MKRKLLFTFITSLSLTFAVTAQRANTDCLDRGLVAVQTNNGVFCSWRINGEEYYDVDYNIYRDGTKLNAAPLNVSNYVDAAGSAASTYTVAPVVRGVEQSQCAAVVPFAQNYLQINTHHEPLTSTYEPNDATVADVDGDGEMELIIKFRNLQYHATGKYSQTTGTEMDIIECYKLNGTRLWQIECGPNMTDFQSNEINIAAYDWDGDGRAECVMRAADNTKIRKADGTVTVIGDPNVDTRYNVGDNTYAFTHDGGEYLLYFDGATGELYQNIEFPLRRLEEDETNLKTAWGDDYGHRSSKYFFGAPYLDGRNPSLFLARGIYTRHKMIAFDIDPVTHELKERWRWFNNEKGAWYAQGYHNYTVADVDWDGRDEIVFGSMVIDDNGRGLSTSGLGHGDAHHVGDFNPYIYGSEFYGCNEEKPANNYRDATTSKIYYRMTGGNDDGRSICGNFTNDVLGAVAHSARDEFISCVSNGHVSGVTSSKINGNNFRIYWDGDLLEESYDGSVYKYDGGTIASFPGTATNNGSKSTPCLQADIFGDWREEIVLRTTDHNIRIYTTTTPTPWRVYTLLDDQQYRNAVITQMNGYNQPPHTGYFLGEVEGITVPPPPTIMRGREEIEPLASIDASSDDKHIIIAHDTNGSHSVADGVAPYILTVNTPLLVHGNQDNDNITREEITHTLTGGAFTGSMRLIKQGGGALVLPNVEQTYSGETDIWGGKVVFNGTMNNSPIWLNRFTELHTAGIFHRAVKLDYDAKLYVGCDNDVRATAVIDTLCLDFGSKLMIDLFCDTTADCVKVKKLTINKFEKAKGVLPLHTPSIVINRVLTDGAAALPPGKYCIAEVAEIEGSLTDIVLSGVSGQKARLLYEDKKLIVEIPEMRAPKTVYWIGDKSNIWDVCETPNFIDVDNNEDVFVVGDVVIFGDKSETTEITIAEPVSPSVVRFAADTKKITIDGEPIEGDCSFEMVGAAPVTIKNKNYLTGTTTVSGGRLVLNSLANANGSETGNLGGLNQNIRLNNGALQISGTVTCSQTVISEGNDTIDVPGTLTLSKGVKGSAKAKWTKSGKGVLTLGSEPSTGTMEVLDGSVNGGEKDEWLHTYPDKMILRNGTINDVNNAYSYSTNNMSVEVPEGGRGIWNMDERCEYKGSLTGSGSLTLKAQGSRCYAKGDWSAFAGTLAISNKTLFFLNSKGLQNAKVSVSSQIELITPNDAQDNYSLKVGGLIGSGTIVGSSNKTLTVGYRNEDNKFSGTVSGIGLTKVGTGKLTMTKIQNDIGTVVVEGGSLLLSPAAADISTNFFGVGTLRVGNGATAGGYCKLSMVQVNNGGTFRAGNNTSETVSYNFTQVSDLQVFGGTLQFCIRELKGKDNSRSFFKGDRLYVERAVIDVRLGNSLNINKTTPATVAKTLTTAIESGMADIVLWDMGKITLPNDLENIEFRMEKLPEGFEWDTSDLLKSKGVLRIVRSTSALQSIGDDTEVRCDVLDMGGTKVASFTATRSEVEQRTRSLVGHIGLYVVRMTAGNTEESLKITIK